MTRCWDLYRHAWSSHWLLGGRENKPATLHLPSAGWGWPHAGHGLRATDSQDSWTNQGRTRAQLPWLLPVEVFFSEISCMISLPLSFSLTDRLWCGVQHGRRRFGSLLKTSWGTTSRLMLALWSSVPTTTSCRLLMSAWRLKRTTSKDSQWENTWPKVTLCHDYCINCYKSVTEHELILSHSSTHCPCLQTFSADGGDNGWKREQNHHLCGD